MRILRYALFGITVLGLTQWPAYGQAKKEPAKAVPAESPPVLVGPTIGPSLRHLEGRKLVFAIESEQATANIANNLQEVLSDMSMPVRVQMVNWCRNNAHRLDFVDHQAQLGAARRVAGWTKLILRDCPGAEIFLVGHGAGARVALAAAEMLPDKSVERIMLFAPGVSRDYDLRPALLASRAGVDNFWSPDDDWLERMCEVTGTADGKKGITAGQAPFRIPFHCDAIGADFYRTLLHQHQFTGDLCGRGGHCTWLLKPNLRKCVVPLIMQGHLEFHASLAVPVAPSPKLPEKVKATK